MPTAASLTLDVGQREGLGSQGSKKRFVSSRTVGWPRVGADPRHGGVRYPPDRPPLQWTRR